MSRISIQSIVIVFMLLFFIATQGYADINSSLLGWWKLNEGSGTVTVDSSGQGNSGTLTNGPTWSTSCIRNNCVNFAVSSTNVVNVGNVSALDITTGDFTISVWVKTTGYVSQGSSINTAVGKLNSNAAGAGYQLVYASTNLPRFSIRDGSANSATVTHTVNISDNKWHLLTGVKSGTTVNIAVDGVLTTGVSAASVGSITNTVAFQIGNDGGVRAVVGQVDDVRVYNRALTAQEIMDLYIPGVVIRGAVLSNVKINQQ